MNDTILKDTLQITNESITNSVIKGSNDNINWWLWLAILEFIIILFLLFRRYNTSKSSSIQKFRKDSLEQEIDFNNIINSSFNSKEIFDELKVKCHPDRFPTDKEKNIIADKLFQEITRNQNNIKRLIELKEEAKQKLNINF